jgi:adenylate kinase
MSAATKSLAIVFLGPPGAGKGTQAKNIARKLGLSHVASGDVFREAIKSRTPLGRKVERIVAQGKLVSDRIATQVVLDHLDRLKNRKGFILDGFPRTRSQAVALDKHLKKKNVVLDSAVLFFVKSSKIVRRLTSRLQCPVCGEVFNLLTRRPRRIGRCDRCNGRLARRRDDQPQVVRKRLQVYNQTARPLLDHYRKSGVFVKVDGEKNIEVLSEMLLKQFRKLRA